jgi:hypothetical protein
LKLGSGSSKIVSTLWPCLVREYELGVVVRSDRCDIN